MSNSVSLRMLQLLNNSNRAPFCPIYILTVPYPTILKFGLGQTARVLIANLLIC